MRKLLLALTLMVISLGACVAVALAADFYAHWKFDDMAGLNRRGYRGPIAGRKAHGEYRIVVLGGSTALGYGLSWFEAFPAQLEVKLKTQSARPISVFNLAYNNEGAYSMRFTLDDYASLHPDLAILYEGYNDFGDERNTQVYRRQSVVFRLTGYFPLLPVVIHEKIMALRTGGSAGDAYRATTRGDKIVFRPSFPQRATIGALSGAEQVADAVARQLDRVAVDDSRPQNVHARGLERKIAEYCDDIEQAVALARSRGIAVLVVGQPYVSKAHVVQQAELARRLAARFGGDSGVRYVNLGNAVDMSNRSLAPDGAHMMPEGYGVIASGLTEPVLQMMTRR